MEKRKIGAIGEKLVCLHYISKGYTILDTNFSCKFGEIDIVAQNDKCLVFVEVKTRKNDKFAMAMEFVTPAKQRRIKTAAAVYLSKKHLADEFVRFDVAEVYGPLPFPRINIIEDAFE